MSVELRLRAFTIVAAGAAWTACSSDNDGGGGDGSSADAGASACPGVGLAPGDSTIDLEFGGKPRSYRLHVPPSYDDSTPHPLVVNVHGFTSTAEAHEGVGLNDEADARGYLTIHPNGTPSIFGTGNAWNAGACCQGLVDDVGFLRHVVQDAGSRVCVDAKRVYAMGISNGGFMTHRLGCEAADVFAAIAPVAGGIILDDCAPSRPVPVLHFHGTGDTLVPFEGGASTVGGFTFPPVPESIDFWVDHDGCDPTPTESHRSGAAHCDTYSGCDAGVEVTLCTIDDGGHCWPGGEGCDSDISANEHASTFFDRFALP